MLGIVKSFLYIFVMSENIEIWKPVVGYEGLYEVSSFGRVRSLDRDDGRGWWIKGRILKQDLCKNGGLRVTLYNRTKKTRFFVHRIVAEAFIPNPYNKPEIDHINTIRTDNTVCLNEDGSVNYDKTNLRWVTHKENMNNPITHTKSINSKLNYTYNMKAVKQFSKDGTLIQEYKCTREAERATNIDHRSINKCCKGIYKTAGGYIWKYKEVA